MNNEFYNDKWTKIINLLPNGGQYRFDIRQHCYNIIKDHIDEKSKIFDYACGLGLIDLQLELQKNCKVYGCDFSDVAIDYINSKIKSKNHFKVTDELFGEKYDYILAIYFLEHIKDPVEWCKEALKAGKKIIAVIPANFNRNGEHVNMQWKDWDSFNELFKGFKMERLDVDKYSNISTGFQHPIFEIWQ